MSSTAKAGESRIDRSDKVNDFKTNDTVAGCLTRARFWKEPSLCRAARVWRGGSGATGGTHTPTARRRTGQFPAPTPSLY